MAGRSKMKLEAVRAELAALNPDAAEVPLIEANVDDDTSLAALAASTAVLINAVGPFTKYGLPVVKVRVESPSFLSLVPLFHVRYFLVLQGNVTMTEE